MLGNLKVGNISSGFLSNKTVVQARNKDVLDFNQYLNSNNHFDESSIFLTKNNSVNKKLDHLGKVNRGKIGLINNPKTGSTVVTDGKGGMKVWLNPLETKNEILKMGTIVHENQHISDYKKYADNLEILKGADAGQLIGWSNKKDANLLEMRAYKEDIRFYEDVLGEKGIDEKDKIVLRQEIKRSESSFLDYKKAYNK